MNILGISFSGNHESAACLVQDGKVVFACAEERLSRVKLDAGFPVRAIRAALKFGGISFRDLDHIAVNWPKPSRIKLHDAKLMLKGVWPLSRSRLERFLVGAVSDWRHEGGRTDLQRAFGETRAQFHYVDHHLAHALSAYCMAPFDDAAVLVVDGRGASEATTIWAPSREGLRCVRQWEYPNSLGVFYAGITRALGFQPLSDEWKVMGLAAYGKPRLDLSRVIKVTDDDYTVDPSYFFTARDDQDKIAGVLGTIRTDDDEIEDVHRDIASSAQLACERALLALVRKTVRETGRRKLCLAGGVALNCKANGELLRSGLIDDMYVQPAAGDDGSCIGAALAVYQKLGRPLPRANLGHTYLGTEWSERDIESALRSYKLPFVRSPDVARDTARLLARDSLVGWFQGRMEFGPRALGNRSIIANPRNAANLVRVNEAVKFRETWRPFAPSVLHEHAHRYFADYRESPYMILSFWASAQGKADLPAVVHVDGSARVQSVRRGSNPRYYDLIESFGRETGVYGVLNTSFNLKGDAIVETPSQAMETFYTSGLDHLVIGDCILSKQAAELGEPVVSPVMGQAAE